MKVLRIIAVAMLAVLALGFGLCGLCVSVLGSGSDAGVGLFLLLVAVGFVVGAAAVLSRGRKAPPPRPLPPATPAPARTPPDDH